MSYAFTCSALVDAYKLSLVRAALAGSNGSASKAARLLAVKRNTIYSLLRRLDPPKEKKTT